jgi:hypothetical protein
MDGERRLLNRDMAIRDGLIAPPWIKQPATEAQKEIQAEAKRRLEGTISERSLKDFANSLADNYNAQHPHAKPRSPRTIENDVRALWGKREKSHEP